MRAHLSASAFVFGLVASLGAASAACPTPAAMTDRGVVLSTSRGNVELHQRTGPDRVRITVEFGGGTGSVLDMVHGIYLERQVDTAGGTRLPDSERVLLSDRAAAAWAKPEPGKVWQNDRRGGGSAASGAMSTVRIGTCRYPGFDVSIRFSDDPTYVETYTYLPEFGIGLLTRSDDKGDVETYRYVSIQAY